MKRNFVILAIVLILTALLGAPSISLAQKGKWVKKADMPTGRSQLAAATVSGLIYVMGGWDGKQELATFEVYNPATDTWKKLADMPTPRRAASAVTVAGKIYICGGVSFKERRGKKIATTIKTVEAYDPQADTWEKKADMPGGRNNAGTAALDGKIYIIGGSPVTAGNASNLFESYDTATDTWAKGAKPKEKRYEPAASAVNGKIYLMGGFRKDRIWIPVVEEYDPATDAWTEKGAHMPTPRRFWSLTAPVAGEKIYAIGGWDEKGKIVKSNEAYDPATDKWAELVKMPTARRYTANVAAKGKIYAIGGSVDVANNEVGAVDAPADGVATLEEYTPEGWPFAVSPQGKLATTWGTLKTTY